MAAAFVLIWQCHQTVKSMSFLSPFFRHLYGMMKAGMEREGEGMDEWSVTFNIASLLVLVYFIGSCWFES
ncbi:hypothetical protein I656_02034 [Geobacillus sp. WSUCF1]|nr:hypothetical protein I656_02034 [Geobacillus sp. WSUCF1]